MKKKLLDASVWKFLLVGVGNTLLSLVLMFLLEGLGYWPSTAIAYVAGAVMSFFLNRSFTFPKPRGFLAVCAEIRRQCGGVLPDCLLHRPARRPVGAWGWTGAGTPVWVELAGQGGGHGALHCAQLLRPAVLRLSE